VLFGPLLGTLLTIAADSGSALRQPDLMFLAVALAVSAALNGIAVCERVPLKVGENAHNRAYLATKASKSGHLL